MIEAVRYVRALALLLLALAAIAVGLYAALRGLTWWLDLPPDTGPAPF